MRARSTLLPLLVPCVLALGLGGCKADKRPATPAKSAKTTKPQKPVDPRSKLQIIDSHVHLTPLDGPFNTALRLFSDLNISKFAVKSAGKPGSLRYKATLRYADYLGEKMAFFTNVDWEGIDDANWAAREAKAVERAMKDGASGIKIFKALGLGVRLKDGKLLKVDDARLDPLFTRCGELGAIVAWHVADPVAFFKPTDKKNERYYELSMAPEWSFYGQDYPSHEALLAARDRVIKKHPKTIFLGIHLANHPEDIDYVDKLLDENKNLYVDVSARLPEIGRHPAEQVKRFFIKHQDRILFGTDMIVTSNGYQLGSVSEKPPTFDDALAYYRCHRRFFETADKQFDHPTPSQGAWKIDGINLPLNVLKKIYVENAERLIFSKRSAYLKAKKGKAS
ncbi:MAG: amidohydrolase family protein [Deltaproteobacteria bacterium]|nr:amidohydrolase family protein [Deltaproteobacteria bacterium]